MRAVVTGSSGMIGTALCERLLGLGYDVTPVDREPNQWNREVNAATRLVDLTSSPSSFDLPSDGVDVIVHLAANARVHDLVVRPELALENIVTCGHALEYARETGAHFIFASSREVYGNQGQTRYRESDATLERVESPYAASKLAGEALVQSYGRVYGLPGTIVRLSNVYGRYDLSERFIPACVKAATSGLPLSIFGAEKQLDFTYLDDVVDCLMAAIEHGGSAPAEVYNVATGQAASLVEAAELVSRALGRPLELKLASVRPGEVVSYEADIAKAAEHLGYRPRFSLSTALPIAIAWYRSQADERRGPDAEIAQKLT
ncbi:MAG: NAD-dependent epimerase/dehydratase family protein [Dehalococcoidia bacterium]